MKFTFLKPPSIPEPPDFYRMALYKSVEAMGGPPFEIRTVSLREREGVWYARAERVYQGKGPTDVQALGGLVQILGRMGYLVELIPPKTLSRWELTRMMRTLCPYTHPELEIDPVVGMETLAYTGEVARRFLRLPLDGSAEGGEEGHSRDCRWALEEKEASR